MASMQVGPLTLVAAGNITGSSGAYNGTGLSVTRSGAGVYVCTIVGGGVDVADAILTFGSKQNTGALFPQVTWASDTSFTVSTFSQAAGVTTAADLDLSITLWRLSTNV